MNSGAKMLCSCLAIALSVSSGVAQQQPLAFDDRCTPAQWKCREASIRRNQATTHPLLRETLPEMVETLGLDPIKRLRNIDLIDPRFAAALYELVRRHPDVLPLWDKKDAEHNVRTLVTRCRPLGDENACYLADLKLRLKQRLEAAGYAYGAGSGMSDEPRVISGNEHYVIIRTTPSQVHRVVDLAAEYCGRLGKGIFPAQVPVEATRTPGYVRFDCRARR
jgi:hypothetical protein